MLIVATHDTATTTTTTRGINVWQAYSNNNNNNEQPMPWLSFFFAFCLFNTKIAFCSLLQQSLLLLLLTDNLIVFCCCCWWFSRVCLWTEKSIWFLITANLRQTNCGLCRIRRINEKQKQKQTPNNNNTKAAIWVTNPYNGTRAADAAAGRKCSKATDAKGDNNNSNNSNSNDCEFKCRLVHWTVIQFDCACKRDSNREHIQYTFDYRTDSRHFVIYYSLSSYSYYAYPFSCSLAVVVVVISKCS